MSDIGGDAACWLERVCDRCGAFVETDEVHTCRAAVVRGSDPEPSAGDQETTDR